MFRLNFSSEETFPSRLSSNNEADVSDLLQHFEEIFPR